MSKADTVLIVVIAIFCIGIGRSLYSIARHLKALKKLAERDR